MGLVMFRLSREMSINSKLCDCQSGKKASHCCYQAKVALSAQSVVFVDTSALRKKELLKCKRDFKKIDSLQSELLNFGTEDRKRFENWVKAEFALDSKIILEASTSIRELSKLIQEVLLEARFENISERSAYRRV